MQDNAGSHCEFNELLTFIKPFSMLNSPWAHLLKRGSSRFSCLLTMCSRKDKNFASITLPSPDVVEVALQDKWFAQCRIQG